nr:SUF system NifU family Fe-S cluster assembly protein [uncultured Ligilactobacillus sp.]
MDSIKNSDLDKLYQEIIQEHAVSPRNYGKLVHKTATKRVFNPICGDDLTIEVEIKNDILQKISFSGEGCILSTASASVMTELVVSKSIDDIHKLINNFYSLVTDKVIDQDMLIALGDAIAFKNVKQFPIRVKCVLMSWDALRMCLKGNQVNE